MKTPEGFNVGSSGCNPETRNEKLFSEPRRGSIIDEQEQNPEECDARDDAMKN
jgi:hypothetical protein